MVQWYLQLVETGLFFNHYPVSFLGICHSLTAILSVSFTLGGGQTPISGVRARKWVSDCAIACSMGSSLSPYLSPFCHRTPSQ